MRLKELRLKKGVTQKVVAKAIFCTPLAYSRYEGAKREPSIATLKLLSQYFGVSIDYIVGNE